MIISVGNIAMGGTGKTPFTMMLARRFMGEGKKVAILSRGYKGRLGYDTHVISDGYTLFHSPPDAADEPYMMALNLPQAVVITGKDRLKSYNAALLEYHAEVFILDDCFQRRAVPRDKDILLLDHNNPVSTGFPFPFGYLREFPSAIKRADIVVLTRAKENTIPKKVQKYCEGKRVFFSKIVYDSIAALGEGLHFLPLSAIYGKSAWLLSGIAQPKQFESAISTLGGKVLGHYKFRDHYAYKESDIEAVFKAAHKAGAELLITTEKDFVRIPEKFKQAFVYPVMKIELNDEEAFWDALKPQS